MITRVVSATDTTPAAKPVSSVAHAGLGATADWLDEFVAGPEMPAQITRA